MIIKCVLFNEYILKLLLYLERINLYRIPLIIFIYDSWYKDSSISLSLLANEIYLWSTVLFIKFNESVRLKTKNDHKEHYTFSGNEARM